MRRRANFMSDCSFMKLSGVSRHDEYQTMKQGNAKTTANVRPRRTAPCIKCGGLNFEIVLTQQISASRLSLVQCASCGIPTEVIDSELPNRVNWFDRVIMSIGSRLALAKAVTDSN